MLREREWEGSHPTDVILHVGTNDIDIYSSEIIMDMTVEVVESIGNRFPQATIHASEMIPRASTEANKIANAVNGLLRSHQWPESVHIMNHSGISRRHLKDEKHLWY